jgi:hypothetical protein
MSLSKAAFGALFLAALPVAAHAQVNIQWLGFQNETSTRLVPAPPDSVGSNDPQEKDFAWADVDHDGDIDFVVVRKVPLSFPGGKRGVLFMNEDGILVDRTQQYASDNDVPGGVSQGLLDEANNRDVVFADFNNDGWLDFATATTISDVPTVLPKYLSHPRIYMNKGADGNGNWLGFKFEMNRSPQLYVLMSNGQPDFNQPYPGRFCGIAAGDVDGDGDIDLYLADYDTGEVGPPEPNGKDLNDRLWLNDGSGTFTDSWQTRMTGQMLMSAFGLNAEIRDMNGEGRNAIVKDSALGAPQSVSISYNISGTPTSPFDLYDQPYSASPYFVSVGDLNNDGKLDMVITDDGDDRYLLNGGTDAAHRATFPTSKVFQFADGSGDEGFGSQSLITDLNGDGWMDVMISNVDADTGPDCGSRLRIYHNLGNAPSVTLKEEAQQSGGGGWKGAKGLMVSDLQGTYHTAAFDLDGDGDQDLILGRCVGTSVWINNLTVPNHSCPTAKFGTASPNSTGLPAKVSWYGSGALTQNLPPGYPDPHSALIFNFTQLPANTTGHLIWSLAKKATCSPYGHGQLCLQSRTMKPFPVLDTVTADANGHARFVFDFAELPLSDAAAGDHLYFQFQYDDAAAPGGGFNLSEAVDVTVCQ